jgi:hypothetical protein
MHVHSTPLGFLFRRLKQVLRILTPKYHIFRGGNYIEDLFFEGKISTRLITYFDLPLQKSAKYPLDGD